MPQQVVTLTPSSTITVEEAMAHVSALLPADVISHMNSTLADGTRTTTVDEVDGVITVTTNWSDSSAATYVTLMDGVSATIKAALDSDGWTYNFAPETADL